MGSSKIVGLCLTLLLWLGWPGPTTAAPIAPAAVHSVGRQLVLSSPADQETAWGDRCLRLVQLERYDEAIADCRRAIQLDGYRPEHRLNRGIALYRTGNFAEALVDNTEALAQNPDDFRGYYNRGLVQVALHRFEAAIADFDQAAALTSDPTPLTEIYDDRGLAKLMAAQPQAALHDFDRALAIDSHDIRALFNHGCACHQMGRLDEALADLNRVLVLDPGHTRTYLRRGLLLRSLGDQAGGVADLQQAADCARSQGEQHLHHYILTLLNEWQTPVTTMG
ncbi:MAG: tetratricopeptide repeat protein [Nodosilinea sp.]